MVETKRLEQISVDDLLLDPTNPRFLAEALSGRDELSQEEMTRMIEEEDKTTTLANAIAQEGVQNPIVVQERDDGKYLVIDGNRRTVTCRLLIAEGEPNPQKGSFRIIPAYVHPKDTSPAEIEILKGVLQEGQRPWGAFQDAAYTNRLRKKFRMEQADIAARLQITVGEVERRMENFSLFEKYAATTGDKDTSRYSYFGEAPGPVRKWFQESNKNRDDYFGLICPLDPKKHKLRSAAYDLREFKKILDNKEALQALIKEPTVSLQDAVAIAEEANVELAAPFLKQIGSWAAKLRSLDESQIELIKNQHKLQVDINKLKDAADALVTRLAEDD